MSNEIAEENLEQVARALGERWARRLQDECGASEDIEDLWPGTLEQARQILDATLGQRISAENREPLAMIVERSARAAWRRRRTSGTHPIASAEPDHDLRLRSVGR
jgi:hypothetical protein